MLILYFKNAHVYVLVNILALSSFTFLHSFLAFSLNCILCAQMRHLILE